MKMIFKGTCIVKLLVCWYSGEKPSYANIMS